MKEIVVDAYGQTTTLNFRYGNYEVCDFIGQKKLGMAVMLYKGDDFWSDVTVSFGNFVCIKNGAYLHIGEDRLPRTIIDRMVERGYMKETPLSMHSGFCEYPLYVFDEAFLREIGGIEYEAYAKQYDEMFGCDEEDGYDGEEL